jgi:putative resolvase
VKLAEWARVNGVHPQRAYRWFREDRMLVPARRLESGTIWVDAAPSMPDGRAVVYARVSSHDQRADLDRQVARLTGWATSNGHLVSEAV